ncbi:MAG TPA: hypothetical protein VHI93_04110 [Candidatus Thermoplasmatota archaeon]|nr:hypothetical protein [Candidatus Thermoplasmatota archaeon]
MANRSLVVTGGVLIAATFLLPMLAIPLAFASGSGASAFATVFLWFFLSPILFIAGVILLIVGAIRSSQQQQQQVVVVAGPAGPSAPPAGGLRPCPACRAHLAAGSRFCTSCGKGVVL